MGRHGRHKPRRGGSVRTDTPAAVLRMGEPPGGREAKPEDTGDEARTKASNCGQEWHRRGTESLGRNGVDRERGGGHPASPWGSALSTHP